MTVPRRDSHATPEREAARLRSIIEGVAHDHGFDYRRVTRLGDGMGGCIHGSSIYPDNDPTLECLAYYRHWPKHEQEDFGYPPEGWFTGAGVWLEDEA